MRFSVIIPNYNNAPWLEKCLTSVVNQTFQDFEIIFVDDMSTDDSVKIAERILRKQDTVVKLHTKRLNGGARNVGIIKAKGDYIICVDSDDWLKNDHVFEDINEALHDQDVLFLDYEVYWSEGTVSKAEFDFKSLKQARTDDTCAIWTKVVKRDLLQNVPFPEGNLFEDRIHHYRLLTKAKTFSCLKKVTHVWNKTNSNSTSQDEKLYNPYKFHYMGELYKFAQEIDDNEFKEYLKNEIKAYFEQTKKLVEEL